MTAIIASFLAAIVAGALISISAPALAQSSTATVAPSDGVVQIREGREVSNIAVIVGTAVILEGSSTLSEVSVADPEIADVSPLSQRAVYLLGRNIGRTNLTVLNENGDVVSFINVSVVPNFIELKARLQELLPGEPVEVRSVADGVVLSGIVSSSLRVSQAMAIAEKYVPGKVTNMMGVSGSQQVLLEVRFAEMKREVAKQLGLNLDITHSDGGLAYALLSGTGVAADAFTSAGVGLARGAIEITAFLDAMEEKGQLRTLAEPTLVALSGDTASFLAGGEVPIPVAQNDDDGELDTTVVFKPFGVSLGFTPTVVHDDLINLMLETEVSAIDQAVSVTANKLAIPGFVVRRADTTVELRAGQSFAIAGLLQEDFRDNVRQMPWVGDVPVLGALFRNTDFERSQTELVIIVTPRLAQPTDGERLQLPTDRIGMPNEQELFLLGRTEGAPPVQAASTGFDSSYGYALE
ncbi:MAG: type II and III secretion system protein family protein [Pseudomonadota bacterium]